MARSSSDNLYGITTYIVDASDAKGSHTTIAAALSDASSGQTIGIRPGTYTEDLTLKAGVNLVAFPGDSLTPEVTISGKLTSTFSGTASITGIRLQTNSDFIIESTGTNAAILNLVHCYLNCTNNTGISITNANAAVFIYDSNGDLGTTGITYCTNTAGSMEFTRCEFMNTGGSSTASTVSAGYIAVRWSVIPIPFSSSGTAILNLYGVRFNILGNTKNITVAGTGGGFCRKSILGSGTATAVTVTETYSMTDCTINCTHATTAIDGAGTLNYANLLFTNTQRDITTTTIIANQMRPGIVRNAQQPAFLAVVSGTVTNVTGDNTDYTIIPGLEVFDQNSDYNTGTGTFTAPYTGKYLLHGGILTQQGTTAMTAACWIVTSNRTYTFGNYVSALNGNFPLQITAIADMDAADTATLHVNFAGGAKAVDIYGTSTSDLRTYFCGEMIA